METMYLHLDGEYRRGKPKVSGSGGSPEEKAPRPDRHDPRIPNAGIEGGAVDKGLRRADI